MRQVRLYKEEIRTRLKSYLLDNLNFRAAQLGLETITNCETGLTSVPASSGNLLPTLFIYIGDRNVSQDWFDSYSVQIGVAFGCGTPQEGEAKADIWEDVIEDVFRTDRSLGDACLTWTGEPTISSVGEPSFWMAMARFDIEYDINAYTDDADEEEETETTAEPEEETSGEE